MRKTLSSLSVVAALLVSVSCGDGRSSSSAPTGPLPARTVLAGGGSNAPVPGTCTTVAAIEAEINVVVPAGPNRGTVHGNSGKLEADVNKKDFAGAQALAFATTKLLIQLYKAHQLTGTQAQAAKLIDDLFCFSGLAITVSDPANSSVIFPTDTTQVILSSSGTSGSSVPTGAVTEPTVLEFVPIADTFGGNGKGPLDTKLDQYGGFVAITASSTTGGPLAHPVVIGVCPPPGMDASVRARLRLGHQASTGFEITPPGDASFLTCPTSVGELPSKMPRWIRTLASLVLPKTAYAHMQFFASGGVGGTAGEFSPFDPVDPALSFSGGVGGTAGEFRRIPPTPAPLPPVGPRKAVPATAPSFSLIPGPRVNTVVAGVCTDTAAVWGGVLEQECSPGIVLKTHLGTLLTGVPVSWSIGLGGGTVALASTPWSCGAFGSSAAATTDVNGESHICWTMGNTPGRNNNTVIATPSVGGDAPPGVTFVPVSGTFTASALRRTPTATSTGGNFTFDGVAHAGSGTCSDGLTPALSYDGDGSVPKHAGSYTLTVTCGDNNVLYNTVVSTAPIVIAQAVPTVGVTCPVSVIYNGAAQTPCTGTVTGPGGLSLTPTPTYTANTDVGTATATVNYAGTTNYEPKSGSATFLITLSPSTTTVSCPVAVVFTNALQTPCTATVTGVGGLSLTPTPTYVSNLNVGIATASVSFAGDASHMPSSGSATFHISPAATTTTVSCPVSVNFTGAPLTPCAASVTGPGLSLTPAPSYTDNTNPGTATASFTYPTSGNWLGSSGSATFLITGSSLPFADGFETLTGWAATGLWNRSTLRNGGNPIVNALFPTFVDAAPGDASNGALPSPFAGSYAFWYGDPATGSYIGTQVSGDVAKSGGTSTSAHSGTLTSPPITMPSVSAGTSIVMRFNTWWDIESVNPAHFDVMQVAVQDVATSAVSPIGVLNPSSDPPAHGSSTPFTSGGFNAPPVWTEVVKDLSAFSGKTVRLIYSFDTGDNLYNGFRGWVIDNVRVAEEPTISASAARMTAPRTIDGVFTPAVQTVTLQPVPSQTMIRRPRQ